MLLNKAAYVEETSLPFPQYGLLHTVVMKSTIFWNITLCSTLKFNRRFGRTYRLHFQGPRISGARYHRESRWQSEFECAV
jgi:hypothetical protein